MRVSALQLAAGGDIAISPDNLDVSRQYLMINEDGTSGPIASGRVRKPMIVAANALSVDEFSSAASRRALSVKACTAAKMGSDDPRRMTGTRSCG